MGQFQSNYPLDGGRFISPDFHQAHHHYSKVVSTHFQVGGLMSKMRDVIRYQTLVQSQVMHYSEMDVPEAKFAYDLSPMAVVSVARAEGGTTSSRASAPSSGGRSRSSAWSTACCTR